MSSLALKKHVCNQRYIEDFFALRNSYHIWPWSLGFHTLYSSTVLLQQWSCAYIWDWPANRSLKPYRGTWPFSWLLFLSQILTWIQATAPPDTYTGLSGSVKLSLGGNGRYRQECKQAWLVKLLDSGAITESAAAFWKTTPVFLLSASKHAHPINLTVLQEKICPPMSHDSTVAGAVGFTLCIWSSRAWYSC